MDGDGIIQDGGSNSGGVEEIFNGMLVGKIFGDTGGEQALVVTFVVEGFKINGEGLGE